MELPASQSHGYLVKLGKVHIYLGFFFFLSSFFISKRIKENRGEGEIVV